MSLFVIKYPDGTLRKWFTSPTKQKCEEDFLCDSDLLNGYYFKDYEKIGYKCVEVVRKRLWYSLWKETLIEVRNMNSLSLSEIQHIWEKEGKPKSIK